MLRRRQFAALLPAPFLAGAAVPARTVVLTLDDAVKSHRTFVAPLLRELGFGATFFVTHRWMNDTANFMTWADIAEIHAMGFEIGNHSWTHADFSTPRGAARLEGELALVDWELSRVKVPKPISFAWCGNSFGPEAREVLRKHGITLARRGAQPEVEYGKPVIGPAYDPARHHPLLIPTTSDAYPDWTFAHFVNVLAEAREGRICVLQFHGVPDTAHPWVHTPPEMFRRYMEHLKKEGYTVLALRDIQRFLPAEPPADPLLTSRWRVPKPGVPLPQSPEVEATRADLGYWRTNLAEHSYTPAEAKLVTADDAPLPVMVAPTRGPKLAPYPGGRHPRIGFFEGAVAPQRGTKATLFLPWANSGYAVIDVPEAIFANGKLIYLAHTHIPSVWDEQNITIPNRDWTRHADHSLTSEWTLPDKVAFGAEVKLDGPAVRMSLWLRNGSAQPLTAMRSQVCVMLARAAGFNAQSNANKTFTTPRATVASADGKRRLSTEWENCHRVWGNDRCPCLHSDPKIPDCAPGETVRVSGRLWWEGD